MSYTLFWVIALFIIFLSMLTILSFDSRSKRTPILFGILLVLGISDFCLLNSDSYKAELKSIKQDRQDAWEKANVEGMKEYPPKLVTKVKDCEIWSFYMNGNDGHYLAICPNGNSSVTYPSGKNSTETISTENK